MGASACRACAINSYSAPGATVCTANAGFYDLGLSLMAYYPFNPNQLTVDVSGNLGSLTVPRSSPVADCTTAGLGPGGNWTSNCASAMQANSNLDSTSPSAQYFSIPNIVLPASYSVCLWYEPTPYSSPNYYEYLFGLAHSSSMIYGLLVERVATTSGIGCVTDNAVYPEWTVNWQPGLYFSARTWYHACFAFSGIDYNFFINGELVASGALGAAQSTTQVRDFNSLFGCIQGPCFQGKMDEVRVYNKSLSVNEVSALYSFRGDSYTTTFPLSCAAGLYTSTVGQSSCRACQAGTFSSWAGLTSCTICAAGMYSSASGAARVQHRIRFAVLCRVSIFHNNNLHILLSVWVWSDDRGVSAGEE